MDRILEWIAENPVYAGVIIAAAVIIVVLVILLIVHAARKSKRNKEKQELSESAAMQNGTDAQAENAAAGDAVSPSDEQTEPVCSKAEPVETEPVLAAQYEAETGSRPTTRNRRADRSARGFFRAAGKRIVLRNGCSDLC